MDANEEKFLRMTTQPVGGLVCRLAVPCIVSMMITLPMASRCAVAPSDSPTVPIAETASKISSRAGSGWVTSSIITAASNNRKVARRIVAARR